jgi:hypothetical protein
MTKPTLDEIIDAAALDLAQLREFVAWWDAKVSVSHAWR